MSNCKRIKAIVSEYIEQDLTREQQRMVEAHLADCKTCDEVVDEVKKLRTNLHTLTQLKTSGDFETILRTRIRIESGLSRRRLSKILWSGPAKLPVYGMAVALIVIASIMVIDQIQKAQKPAIPEAYINTEMYGGGGQRNQQPASTLNASENVYWYPIDKVTPDQVKSGNASNVSSPDSTRRTMRDTVTSSAPVQRVTQKTF